MYVTGQQRHNQAILAPSGKDEKALVQILRGLQEYSKLLDASLPDDNHLDGRAESAARTVLNQGLSDIARGLQKLTQGPLGRLDAELLAEELAPFIQDGNLSLVASDLPGTGDEQIRGKRTVQPASTHPTQEAV